MPINPDYRLFTSPATQPTSHVKSPPSSINFPSFEKNPFERTTDRSQAFTKNSGHLPPAFQNLLDSSYAQVQQPTTKTLDQDIILNIPFYQDEVIDEVGNHCQTHRELHNFIVRFNGLCELICNKMLIGDLLGAGKTQDFLKKSISIDTLNTETIKSSHLLDVYSTFERMIAFIFRIYPDNILLPRDQWRLTSTRKTSDNATTPKITKVNSKILEKGLKKIPNGETLKLSVFHRDRFIFSGHSLLIKKISDKEYIFFDPNKGEERKLSFNELTHRINKALKEYDGTDLFFMRGKSYLKKLQDKKILKIVKNQI